MTGRKSGRSNVNVEVAATPRHQPFILEANTKSSQRDLEAGVGFVITNQQIRDAQRVLVERAPRRDARFPKTESTQILDAR